MRLCFFTTNYVPLITIIWTPMLLVANIANTKWCKKPANWLKPWHVGTHLRVLSETYLMNTNRVKLIIKNRCIPVLWQSSLSIRRVNLKTWSWSGLFSCPVSFYGAENIGARKIRALNEYDVKHKTFSLSFRRFFIQKWNKSLIYFIVLFSYVFTCLLCMIYVCDIIKVNKGINLSGYDTCATGGH